MRYHLNIDTTNTSPEAAATKILQTLDGINQRVTGSAATGAVRAVAACHGRPAAPTWPAGGSGTH